MKYFLSQDAVLKWLETPSVYVIEKDELYELDGPSFGFLKNCASSKGCNTDDRGFIDYCLSEGILTEEFVPVSRPSLIKSPEPSLRYLELQITEKCNFACKHCFLGEKSFSELSVNQIKAILKEFEEMQGLRVLITGGEPLVHRQFEEINECLPDFLIRKVLFTNGSLLSKKILKRLHVNEIQISIDGLENAHDSLRGKGTYRLAMEAVKRAINSGFEVSISTMVHSHNLEDFDEMGKLFRELGIKDWTVDIPCIVGDLKKHTDFHISPHTGGKYFKYGCSQGLHTSAEGFGCGLHLMAVMADGRVAKCSFYKEHPVGSCGEGIKECWKRIQPIRLEDLQCDCIYVESCRGGCRFRAGLLGDPLGRDLYKCSFYGVN